MQCLMQRMVSLELVSKEIINLVSASVDFPETPGSHKGTSTTLARCKSTPWPCLAANPHKGPSNVNRRKSRVYIYIYIYIYIVYIYIQLLARYIHNY